MADQGQRDNQRSRTAENQRRRTCWFWAEKWLCDRSKRTQLCWIQEFGWIVLQFDTQKTKMKKKIEKEQDKKNEDDCKEEQGRSKKWKGKSKEMERKIEEASVSFSKTEVEASER